MTPRLHPVARYTDARAALAFFERAFGFTRRAVFDAPDGSVAHAELAFGTGAIGVSSAGPVNPAQVWTTVREGLYACVPDADAAFARATSAGARVEQPLRATDYGSHEFTVRDPEGRLWSVGTYAMSDGDGPAAFVPEIRCQDGTAMLMFLEQAFGLTRGLIVPAEDGTPSHAELWLGPSPLFVASGDLGADWWGTRTQCTQVYVPDPDAHHDRARAAGAMILRAPHDTPYGARAYLTRDPEGCLWGFSTYRPRQAETAVAGRGAATAHPG